MEQTDRGRKNHKKVHRQLPGDMDVVVEQVIASIPLSRDGVGDPIEAGIVAIGTHYAESGFNEGAYRFELPDNRIVTVGVSTTVQS